MGNSYIQACYLEAQENQYYKEYIYLCRSIVFTPGYPQFTLFVFGFIISFILIVIGIYFICKHRRQANKIPSANVSQGQIQFQQPTQLQQNAQQLPYQYQQASNQYQQLASQTILDQPPQTQYQNRNYSPADYNFNQGVLQQPTYSNTQPIENINQNYHQNQQVNSEVNRYVPIQAQNETVESRRYDPTNQLKPAEEIVNEASSNIRFTGNEASHRNEISQPFMQREIPLALREAPSTEREIPLTQRQVGTQKLSSPLIQLPQPFTAEHRQMQQEYKQRQAEYYQKLPIDFYPPPPPGFKYVITKINE